MNSRYFYWKKRIVFRELLTFENVDNKDYKWTKLGRGGVATARSLLQVRWMSSDDFYPKFRAFVRRYKPASVIYVDFVFTDIEGNKISRMARIP